MAVAALHYYLAPLAEAQKVGKSLLRVLRTNREVQYVVLSNIATMACTRPVRIPVDVTHTHYFTTCANACNAAFVNRSSETIFVNVRRCLRDCVVCGMRAIIIGHVRATIVRVLCVIRRPRVYSHFEVGNSHTNCN